MNDGASYDDVQIALLESIVGLLDQYAKGYLKYHKEAVAVSGISSLLYTAIDMIDNLAVEHKAGALTVRIDTMLTIHGFNAVEEDE